MIFEKLTRFFSSRKQRERKIFLILIDSLLILISIFTSYWFLDISYLVFDKVIYFLLLNLITSLPIYYFTGQYKGITRFIGSRYMYRFLLRNLLIIIFLILVTNIFGLFQVSLKLWILIFLFQTLLTTSARFLFRDLISKEKLLRFKTNTKNILIYGAGSAGADLAKYISRDNRYQLSGFIDDSPDLWDREIGGIKIYKFENINKLIKEKNIKKIFFAIPSLKSEKCKIILKNLQQFNLEVLRVPSFEEITRGKMKINNLLPISEEDLLMRKPVRPNNKLLGKSISNKNILISGAGGSIGSELCRQILHFNPKKIILFEQNEPSLYIIYEELKELIKINYLNVEITPILGNTCDENLVRRVFTQNNINIVFHAAAHKHVPLVEVNPIEGLKNNILATLILSKIALEKNVDKFSLISSDKAVRPTSIMGASKRISEIIIQNLSQDILLNNHKNKTHNTIFSMVRFGNVLNSSGSVIPRFQIQISKGGPVTITHPEITRYFMTITEAIELVLQTSSMSKGGEIYLLDMGNSVKILELAKQLISLSGLTVKDKNKEGDIEIIYTGLRKGEKLYEELLIDSSAEKTDHPLIYKSKETIKYNKNIMKNIKELIDSLVNQNDDEVYKKLSLIVEDWKNS